MSQFGTGIEGFSHIFWFYILCVFYFWVKRALHFTDLCVNIWGLRCFNVMCFRFSLGMCLSVSVSLLNFFFVVIVYRWCWAHISHLNIPMWHDNLRATRYTSSSSSSSSFDLYMCVHVSPLLAHLVPVCGSICFVDFFC